MLALSARVPAIRATCLRSVPGASRKPPFTGDTSGRRGASSTSGNFPSRNTLLKSSPDWIRVHTSFGRESRSQRAGEGVGHDRTGQDAAPPRLRSDGRPAAAYARHVAPGGVLVVVDLDRSGWRSVTNDAEGVVSDLAELRPDLLARVPLVPYRDSMGRWDALRAGREGAFAGFALIGAASEEEAVAWVLARHD